METSNHYRKKIPMTFSKGDRVTYVPYPGATPSGGEVTALMEHHSFVRFDGDRCSKPIPNDLLTEVYPCGHEVRTKDCGGCDPGAGWTLNAQGITVADEGSTP